MGWVELLCAMQWTPGAFSGLPAAQWGAVPIVYRQQGFPLLQLPASALSCIVNALPSAAMVWGPCSEMQCHSMASCILYIALAN